MTFEEKQKEEKGEEANAVDQLHQSMAHTAKQPHFKTHPAFNDALGKNLRQIQGQLAFVLGGYLELLATLSSLEQTESPLYTQLQTFVQTTILPAAESTGAQFSASGLTLAKDDPREQELTKLMPEAKEKEAEDAALYNPMNIVELAPEEEKKQFEACQTLSKKLDSGLKIHDPMSRTLLQNILAELDPQKLKQLRKIFLDNCKHKGDTKHPTDQSSVDPRQSLLEILDAAHKKMKPALGERSGASRYNAFEDVFKALKTLDPKTNDVEELIKIIRLSMACTDIRVLVDTSNNLIENISSDIAWAVHLNPNQFLAVQKHATLLKNNPDIAARFYSALPRHSEFQVLYHSGELPVLDALDKAWRIYEAQRFTCTDTERYAQIIHLKNLIGFCVQQNNQGSLLSQPMSEHLNSLTQAIQTEVDFVRKTLPLLPVHPTIYQSMQKTKIEPALAKKSRSWIKKHPYYTAFIALLTLASIATIIVAAFLGLTTAVAPILAAIVTVFSSILIGVLPQGVNNYRAWKSKTLSSAEKFSAYKKAPPETQITLANKENSPHRTTLAVNELMKGNLETLSELAEEKGLEKNHQYRKQLLILDQTPNLFGDMLPKNKQTLKTMINNAEIEEGRVCFEEYVKRHEDNPAAAEKFFNETTSYSSHARGTFVFTHLLDFLSTRHNLKTIQNTLRTHPFVVQQFLQECLIQTPRKGTDLLHCKNIKKTMRMPYVNFDQYDHLNFMQQLTEPYIEQHFNNKATAMVTPTENTLLTFVKNVKNVNVNICTNAIESFLIRCATENQNNRLLPAQKENLKEFVATINEMNITITPDTATKLRNLMDQPEVSQAMPRSSTATMISRGMTPSNGSEDEKLKDQSVNPSLKEKQHNKTTASPTDSVSNDDENPPGTQPGISTRR